MASSRQDEEVHHRMKEDALDDEDLNNEAQHEDDGKKIVASESETSEQEVKDANQEGGMMMVPSTTTTTPRSLTQEEEEEEAMGKAGHGAAILSYIFYDDVPPKDPSVLEIDDHQEDDSEQTLRFLTRWKAPEIPPKKIIHHSLIEQCSRPIQKQLTTSDVRQRKLSLPRKKCQQLLNGSGKKVARVSVYGPDGKVHEMWLGDDDEERCSFELTLGWRKFVVDYELKECCDFVTVWMFRHRGDTQRICLAVDAIRFSFRNEVSKRISDAAFEDSN